MERTTIELIKIVPSNGMILTNGETYSYEVYLGANDSIDNWQEITVEEYEKIMAERENEELNTASVTA